MYSLPKKKTISTQEIDVAPAEVNYRQKSTKSNLHLNMKSGSYAEYEK